MTCLFVYVYLLKGPSFVLDTKLERSPAITITQAWQKNFTPPTTQNLDYLSALQLEVIFNSYTPSTVYAPTCNADATLLDLAQAVQIEGLMTLPTADASEQPEPVPTSITDGSIFSGVDVSQYSPVSYRLWKHWMNTLDDQSPGNFWRAGLMAAAAQTLNSTSSAPYSEPASGADGTQMTILHFATHGKDLADWYKNHQNEPYMNGNVNLNNMTETKQPEGEYLTPPIMSCFIAGTRVETLSGSKAIEDLTEGVQVLTRADGAKQWERRAGHPFYTTTGLRAIDPETDRQENPWLEVGQLKPGHVLFRLNAEKEYELETIKPINSSRSDVSSVYGVHLREGFRSYHANGYLVAINYPEITAVSITRQLKTFPPAERAAMIQSIGVLKPLFERFGAGTVMDKLIKEAGSV
ncbi:hypothetical protein CDV36_006873 [Fusarium kuroshium]|uniref:Hedgehog/Intein (Hint) domain-containing protein n=1 Tax=Fusarium kuroshium TaxID=2010991 RepID=A0A3M2S8J0_9HYPO|nr:hypothetical protein CDV36_006873 [Fusarium kuroshium]